MVQLPISSIVDEFKAGKMRFHMMVWDCPDQELMIHEVQPEVKSGWKWAAKQAVTEEASLRTKEMIRRWGAKW